MGTAAMSEQTYDHEGHARAMREAGFWVDKSFDELLIKTIAATPDKTAFVADRADRSQRRRISYAEFGDMVARAAGSLRNLGIGRGDVIAVQLPNWWEFAVVTLAAFRLGAAINPLTPIFREHELSFMLGFAEAKLFIVPTRFRGFDYEAMAKSLKPSLPHLEHVIVVDGEGGDSFDRMLLSGDEIVAPPPPGDTGALPPDEMASLLYTSGTTGSPKGVVHCLNTLMGNCIAISGRMKLSDADTLLVCSPLGHMMGFAGGMLLGLSLGTTIVLQDSWEPARGVQIMADEGVTYTSGAVTFLSDICEAVKAGAPRPEKLKKFLCGGAPIPPVIVERAWNELGVQVCSCWGMTETLAGTLTELDRSLEKSPKADGSAVFGMEVKVQRPDGTVAPAGEIGELKVRGSLMTLGYHKRPDLQPFDDEGWFDTGDLAFMDEDGYIRISGRNKDIVIRGGENVPVADIENLLFKHPAILLAAVVGYPDSRLGERACAFVILRPGESFDLRALQTYMADNKVAKQYWPERIEIVQDMPKTASGKVQKFQLREQAKAFGDVPLNA